jgi:FtsP/CotA-like multicopper oxidase with cupredoxin domain
VLVDGQDLFGRGLNTRGTPIEILINNSRWSGRRDGGGNAPIPGAAADQSGQDVWMTELPRVGSTEIWEILDLSLVAHPIHIHLIQFQLLNREPLAPDPLTGVRIYSRAYNAAFPGGAFNGERPDGSWGPGLYPPGLMIPGYGPPNNYFSPNADGALGGNPAFSPFLAGAASRIAPNPNEAGWKDVAKVFVGFVTRYAVRWAPQAVPVSEVKPGQNRFSFDPTRGPGYVIHCHALDHEDNEMMRPYLPVP